MKVFEVLVERKEALVGSTADLGVWHGGIGALLGDVVKRADGWYFADGTKIKDPSRIARAEKVHKAPPTAPTTSKRPNARPEPSASVRPKARPTPVDKDTKLSIGQEVEIPKDTDTDKAPVIKNNNFKYDLSKFNIHEQRLIKRGVANGMGDLELAAFLAQSAHETQNFKKLTEDTSGAKYEPKWVKDKKTKKLRQVKGKATIVGNKKKGDGALFMGRGYLHLTGRWNYTAAARELNNPEILSNPDIVATPSVGLDTAIWYWNKFVEPKIADWSNNTEVTQAVNGGQTGATERGEYFDKYTKLITAAKQEKKK
jgi:putative chitinase